MVSYYGYESGLENSSKIMKKNIQGMIETIPFSISILQIF